MIRNRIENKPNMTTPLIIPTKKNRNSKSTILPPSTNENVANSYESMETTRSIRRVQNSSAIFDPNNASPASNFMDLLKLRMSIYYDTEMDIFQNNNGIRK